MLNLRKKTVNEEIDYNLLLYLLSNYKNPRVKINDLLKKKMIIRVKKGLYVFGPELSEMPYCKETLANLIYGPSCISLEYALSYYGFIPERVETITSVTNKRNKYFKTPIGNFSYRYINNTLFSKGMTVETLDSTHQILIASKEKALIDLLYYQTTFDDIIDLKTYLVNNLRISENDLYQLDINKIKELAPYYKKNSLLLYELLKDRT